MLHDLNGGFQCRKVQEILAAAQQVEKEVHQVQEIAQSKHQLYPEIGTENTKGPESECKDGGDTSINVPGDNAGTDVVSSQEGASDDKKDEPPVLPSNPPLNGKILMYQKYLESKQQQQEEKKKKEKKEK
jgi:hypothetical protein